MNISNPFYIFSVERKELSAEENAGRTAFVHSYLQRAGLPHFVVNGRYRGCAEKAFLVFDSAGWPDLRGYISNLARLYEQESFLYVDANGLASLHSSNNAPLGMLGRWQEIPADKAALLEAVTQSPDGRYWSAA